MKKEWMKIIVQIYCIVDKSYGICLIGLWENNGFQIYCNAFINKRPMNHLRHSSNQLTHLSKVYINVEPMGSGLPFHYYLHLEKGRALHLKKLESLSPKMLCAKFG